jgi:hypothetical protein
VHVHQRIHASSSNRTPVGRSAHNTAQISEAPSRIVGDLGVAVRFVSGTRMVTRSKPGARAASSLVSGHSGPSAVNRGTIFRRGTHRKAIRLLYFALESRLFECLRCLQSPGFRGFHGWS